jgi:hypothetical protein
LFCKTSNLRVSYVTRIFNWHVVYEGIHFTRQISANTKAEGWKHECCTWTDDLKISP